MIAGVCHNKLANFFALLIMVFSFCYFATPASAYQEYLPNTTILLGEFVYDDDFTATTTPCQISVFSPSGAVVASTTMTAEANGWHYYNLAPTTTEGIWPAVMQCGSTLTGDLIKQDKTFVITSNIVSTSSIASAVWSSSFRSLTTFGSLVSDIWASGTRTLTDYSTSSIATAVWSNNTRSLTTFGSLITDIWANPTRTISSFGALAADIWNNIYAPTRNLTDATLTSGSLATLDNVNNASSTVGTQITAAQSNINSNTTSAVNNSSSTIGTQISSAVTAINTNTNNATGTIAASVWANTTRTLTDYSSTTIATAVWSNGTRSLTTFGSLIADIWANPTRTISSFGALAADIWNNAYAPTRNITDATLSSGSLATLSDVNSATTTLASNINANTNSAINTASSSLSDQIDLIDGSASNWTATLTNAEAVLIGNSYRAKIHTYNQGVAANTFALPAISLYDGDRNLIVSAVNMTNIATGVYEYVYSVSNGATQGNWESIINTEVESGNTLQLNDYWEVRGSPAQVIINSISDSTTPSIGANLTITNEGLSGYEYQYEWCVVSTADNACGGGNDVFHGVAAKYINAGEDWNTTLTADVSTAGAYYFKAVVYFGTESSGASRSFTATTDSVATPPASGATGGTSAPATPTTETESSQLVSMTDGKLVLMPNQRGSLNNGIGNDCRVSVEIPSNVFTSQLVFDIQGGDSPKAIGKKYFDIIAKDSQDNRINSFAKALGISLTCPSLASSTDNLGVYYYNEKNTNWSLLSGPVFDTITRSVKFSTRELNRFAVFNKNDIEGNDSKQRRLADLNSDTKINSVDFSILLSFYKTKPPFANPYVDMNKDSKVDAIDFSIMLSMWDKK